MNDAKTTVKAKTLTILMIEDDADDTLLIREMLTRDPSFQFRVEHSPTLESGLVRLAKDKPDMLLLDLNLPDSQGLDTFMRVRAQAPHMPIVILTGFDDENFALEALRQGAQDYIVKGTLEDKMLPRAVHYAIERNRTDQELRSLLLVDELTGLYNRQGFLTFADQYMKLAQRNREGLILVFADITNLERIRETFGQHEGDLAELRTAKTLRDTFRKSDVIGHISTGHFAIITAEAARDKYEVIRQRLQNKLIKYDSQATSRYKTSLTIGHAYYDPQDANVTVEDLMNRADQALGREKGQR
ncbi:MAG TPA: diguanylate cyclase [Candidatus Eisenbacteria bacterium]|jgi:diguanylate cyclase (GGDEF)-like protein|nr:diguanylate cyclase [Candidatus Eisenbacteria bacterium]